MINAANFTPSISANNGLTNSIAPVEKKYVTINGQQYPVEKVQDNNPLVKTFAPSYKEVVTIDGQQYDVEKVQDNNPLIGSIMPTYKEIVVVDGQQYDVENTNKINLNGGFTFNPNARINADSTMSYMA